MFGVRTDPYQKARSVPIFKNNPAKHDLSCLLEHLRFSGYDRKIGEQSARFIQRTQSEGSLMRVMQIRPHSRMRWSRFSAHSAVTNNCLCPESSASRSRPGSGVTSESKLESPSQRGSGMKLSAIEHESMSLSGSDYESPPSRWRHVTVSEKLAPDVQGELDL